MLINTNIYKEQRISKLRKKSEYNSEAMMNELLNDVTEYYYSYVKIFT